MSKVYQIRLGSSIEDTIHARDEVRHRVELTPILDAESMDEVLGAALVAEGWTEHEDGVFQQIGPGGEVFVWDIEGAVVTATVEVKRDVEADLSATGWGDSAAQARQDATSALARQRALVEADVRETEASLEGQLSAALVAGDDARQQVLNRVIQRVYGEALKRKAAHMGTVLSVEERQDGDEYELVIRLSE